jgi:hypothetical protein
MWYIYAMEYYSAIKKKGLMLFEDKWMGLEIVSSKVNQAQGDKGHMFSLICRSCTQKINSYMNTCIDT